MENTTVVISERYNNRQLFIPFLKISSQICLIFTIGEYSFSKRKKIKEIVNLVKLLKYVITQFAFILISWRRKIF